MKHTTINDADRQCNEMMKWTIKRRKAMLGLNSKQLALAIGLKSGDTFDQKVRHTERFKVGELRTLFRILEFSDDEITDCLRVRMK